MTRKPYPSDISREKFSEIEPLLRSVRRSTKPIELDLYEVFCAVLYLLRTGSDLPSVALRRHANRAVPATGAHRKTNCSLEGSRYRRMHRQHEPGLGSALIRPSMRREWSVTRDKRCSLAAHRRTEALDHGRDLDLPQFEVARQFLAG